MIPSSGLRPGPGPHPRRILVVVAHADDAALFCGGTLARWADEGWELVLVRVTDDATDSVGLDPATTVERNRAELHVAARILGISRIVDLGWPTDTLADRSEVELRGLLIEQVRTWRPYAIVSFDPYGAYFEDNQDHLKVAAAVDETTWTAMFDKHHPEHLEHGLAPHGVFERWYFARRLTEVTDVVEIGPSLGRKVEAILAHRTMMEHLLHQLRLLAGTGGYRVRGLPAPGEDPRPFIEGLVRERATRTGARWRLGPAEEFRVVRFLGMEDLLDPPDAGGSPGSADPNARR